MLLISWVLCACHGDREGGWTCEGEPSLCSCAAFHGGLDCELCVVYVDEAAAIASRDGTSWETALDDVQAAADVAAGLGAGCEVWVAAGTYGVHAGSRADSLVLPPGVALYGGFGGHEQVRSERNPALQPSILDGRDPGGGPGVYHVVVGSEDSRLDGFTVTGGEADGGGADDQGGGYWNGSMSGTVAGCLFQDNHAAGAGGALYSGMGSITVLDSTFLGNTAENGGAIYINRLTGAPTISSCLIQGNSASQNGAGAFLLGGGVVADTVFAENVATVRGGGVEVQGFVDLLRCSFRANRARDGAGVNQATGAVLLSACVLAENIASAAGGGFRASAGLGVSRLESCLLWGNRAQAGAGLWVDRSAPEIVNCTIADNAASGCGGGLRLLGLASPLVQNSIFWGNLGAPQAQICADPAATPTVTFCDVDGGYAGTGNSNATPLFVGGGDYRLQPGSPCIDAGLGDSHTPGTDLAGLARNDAGLAGTNGGQGSPAYVDLGANEHWP